MSSTDTIPLQPLAVGGHKCTKNEECGEGTCSKFKCHCRDGFVGPTCLVRILIISISSLPKFLLFLLTIIVCPLVLFTSHFSTHSLFFFLTSTCLFPVYSSLPVRLNSTLVQSHSTASSLLLPSFSSFFIPSSFIAPSLKHTLSHTYTLTTPISSPPSHKLSLSLSLSLSHTHTHTHTHTIFHRLRMDSMILNGRKNKTSHCRKCSYLLLSY